MVDAHLHGATISCQALVSYRYHGLSVWLPELHAGAFKAFLLMQLTSATVEEINSHKGRKKKLNSEKGTRYRKKQEMLIVQVLPVSELLKFIRTQLTLYKQKYISLHSVFKFPRGHKCCKQTVLGVSSVVHGERILRSHACAEKLNSQSRI